MYIIVNFVDDTFWTGTDWRKRSVNALKIPSKSDAMAIWRSLSVDDTRDVWLIKDYGRDSEKTIATTHYGVLHP